MNHLLITDQIRATVDAIENGKFKPSFKTCRKHVANVKQTIKTRSDDMVCPKSGSGIMFREAKKGVINAA